jgi:hypothetical protein
MEGRKILSPATWCGQEDLQSKLQLGGAGSYSFDGTHYVRQIHMIEIENAYCENGKTQVAALTHMEARAMIAQEYGFEFGHIKIEGICWYCASDYNHFSFSVRGRRYEADDYETPVEI